MGNFKKALSLGTLRKVKSHDHTIVSRSAKEKINSKLACSKRSDSGERCGVEKAMKSRGGLGREVSSLAFTFSRSLLLCSAPHYLNAWNRLIQNGFPESQSKQIYFLIQNRLFGKFCKCILKEGLIAIVVTCYFL